jgi:flagellar biogenesis protein FliO
MDSSANIYTVLLMTAALALIGAVGYVLVRSNDLFGGNPFSVQIQSMLDSLYLAF